jgi:hypothetical protein
MIAKSIAHFMMEAIISVVYFTESPSTSMVSGVTDSIHQLFHLPHVEVDYDEKDSLFVQSGLRGEGFDYNNTATYSCNTVDYPLYDPDYFDDYCTDYYWCFRNYDYTTCAPTDAWGMNEEQAEWVILLSWYSMFYMEWLWVGVRFIPWTSCLFLDRYRTVSEKC